jgi:AcrR family transcriptional regulator
VTATVEREPDAPGRARSGRREAPRRRRRTKGDYLETALTLADERSQRGATAYGYALAHVDMARVAEVAGVSRSALYRLWETQEAFRADLAAYLAAQDDAPWMEVDRGRFDAALGDADGLHALTRDLLDAGQDQLSADPRPLLRAGLAGYPNAEPVTAVIAERERRRLDRHADLVDRALRSAGRRCVDGLRPGDLSVVTNCLADGLALAARMTPPGVPLAVGSETRPYSLLAVAMCTLVKGLSEPGPQAAAPGAQEHRPVLGADLVAAQPDLPQEAVGLPTGRRLDYLRIAAQLAASQPPGDERSDGFGLGYVRLDTVARAEGVTRGAVRKLWPTEAAFRHDLFAHLLARHRTATVGRLEPAVQAGDGGLDALWLRVGDELFAQVGADLARVSHLTFAPQLVLPGFRAHARRHAGALLDRVAPALGSLLAASGRRLRPGIGERRLAVLVLALLDGATRLVRTLPEAVRRDVPYRCGTHSVLAISFAGLLSGLSRPHPTQPRGAS